MPLLVLAGSLALQFYLCGDLRPHFSLLMGTFCALTIGWFRGKNWKELSQGTFETVATAMPALAIYLLVGPVISTWIASGTLPTIILWGVKYIRTQVFLPVSFLLMAFAGIVMGSGASALGILGIALAGLGQALGFPSWLIAGTIGTGAFWGNGVSPLAATTNLTCSVTGCATRDLLKMSLRRMVPPLVISIVLFALIGLYHQNDTISFSTVPTELELYFTPHILSLLPLALLLGLIILGKPALPSIGASILTAIVIALLNGGAQLSDIPGLVMDGYSYKGTNPLVGIMLNRGGIKSISSLLIMLMMAMAFGGSYEASGTLEELVNLLLQRIRSAWALRALSVASGLISIACTGSASLSVILIGKLFSPVCDRLQLPRLDLAVTLGPIIATTSVLFPWGVSGFFLIDIMHLPVSGSDLTGLLYIPVCFASLLCPIWVVFSPLSPSDTRNNLSRSY